jgi:type I restriction enzyme S subunit
MRDWRQKSIGEVCEVVNGGTPKTNVQAYWDGPHAWVTPAEMGRRSSPYISETARTLTDLGLSDSSARLLPPYSVILSSRAPIGHLVINTMPMATNQGCKGLVPTSDIHHKFLYYYLGSRVELLNALGTGATFKELSAGKLKEVSMPVPPLAEQQRIVSLLDEAFEGIATAKENAARNFLNAHALFKSHLREVFDLPAPGWVSTTIGDQLTLQRGFDITKAQQVEGPVPVVSSGGIKSFHNEAMVSGPGVVIGRKGTLGKVFFIESSFWPHDTTLWVKDFKGNEPRFVYYLFTGLDVKKLDSGAANPALNRNQVHPIRLFWPPVESQRRIVETLDELEDQSILLAQSYERKVAALDALKISLLHRAFSGQL